MDLTSSFESVFPRETLDRYVMREVRDAAAIVSKTSPEEFDDIRQVLAGFALDADDFLVAGGSKSNVARRLDEHFRSLGWREARCDTRIQSTFVTMPYKAVGETMPYEQVTEVFNEGYKVDNFKNKIALDVEWNAKDGNLDRDLSAYRALYEAGVITAGVIVTRTQTDLRELGTRVGRDPFGTSTTTNLDKLEPRLTRGDSGGCPVLAIAVTARCFAEEP